MRRSLLLVVALSLFLAGCQGAAPTALPTSTSAAPTAAVQATSGIAPGPRATPTNSAATPQVASPVAAGAVCAFAPPLPRVATPVARPTATATPRAGQPTRRPQAAAPEQEPPSIPLPQLAARYTLAVDGFTFAPGRSAFRVAETVAVTNGEGCALDHLTFSITAARWGWFTLGAARVGGQAVEARLVGTVLTVPLAQPLASGATVEVAFDFGMAVGPPSDPYTLAGFAGTLHTENILRLAYWFPILSDDHQYPPFLDPPYTASADFDVTLTLPSNLVVAHTGIASEQRPNGDNTTTYRIQAQRVRDFVLGISPNYRVARRMTAGGVVVELFYDPNSFGPSASRADFVQQKVDAALAATVLAVDRLGGLIGPYPYPVLRVVDGGLGLLGGIEFPMLITVNLALPDLNNLIYHEVAHEWFYGVLGTRTQQDPWIDEGAATFLADYLDGTLSANPPAAAGFTYRLSDPVWEVPPAGFQNNAIQSVYTQGGAFYTRVMRTMGEEAFWRALRRLYADHRFGIITPRDILAVWQAESATDLRPLFKEYLDYPWIEELGR